MSTHPPPRRVCFVTAGGDAPGVNAALRAFVHVAVRGHLALLGSRYGFEGLLDPAGLVPLTLESVRGILPLGGSVLGCSTRLNPFYNVTRSSPEPRDMGPAIVERLRAAGVEALALTGGDGTALAAKRFADLGMPSVLIPKTIDNDLGATDQTCGFDTALETASRAIDTLHSTAEAHQRVMIVETMGRNAGWIALRAGIAGGADVVLIPEIPYRLARIADKIREREALGRRFSIIAVAEGARPEGGKPAEIEPSKPGLLARLGGAGHRLAAELDALGLGHEIRVTVLGHLQRGGTPSAYDRTLGTRLGVHAAKLCLEGRLGRVVVLRNGLITSLPLEEALGAHKVVDPSSELVAAARAVGIELGD